MNFGDFIEYNIKGSPEERGTGYVIGVPRYSEGMDDVVMLADGQYHGMPINACWCKHRGDQNVELAQQYRERYDSLHPGFLKATSS